MPSPITDLKKFYVASYGRSPIGLVECLADKDKFALYTNSDIFRFIGVSAREYAVVAVTELQVVCDDRERIYAAVEEREPLLLRAPDLYLFGKQAWQVSDDEQTYHKDQLRLLFLDELDRERQKWDRLKRRFSNDSEQEDERSRKPIPERVRMIVWRRDMGKCVICGSNENLEFDHIVPFSKGGSNTDRNIQLLCEACNRAKSDKI